jgi:hypothetical protein
MLVRQGALTEPQLNHALDVQTVTGRPLGELCERLFDVPSAAVRTAWAQQYLAIHGECDGNDLEPEADCIAMLNPRQAWQFRLVPVRRDFDTNGIGHLIVAAGRRDLAKAMTFACRTLPLAPAFVVVTPTRLRALLTYYYKVSPQTADWAFNR